MELRRTVVETYNARERYYNDLNRTENGSNYFWQILIALIVILILIILFIFCYYYIFGKIISTLKRYFTWRNKQSNIDDNLLIMKENDDDSGSKRRFLWPNASKISKFRTNFNNEKDKQYENKCYNVKTLLPEKKKLLTSCGNKTVTSNNNVDLTKQLSLKMSFSSFLSPATKSENIRNKTLNKWDIKDLESYKHNELSTQSIEVFDHNLHENDKDICFSDTDLKLLVIPIPSKKSNIIKHDRRIMLCEWNSKNINDYYNKRNDTSSKLIELKFQSTDSCSDNTQKYGISNSKSNCSPCSFISKNLTSDSKYFSDSVTNRFENLQNMYLTRLQRSTNSYASSTVTNISNTNKTKVECPQNDTSDTEYDLQVLHVKSKENNSKCTTDENTKTAIDKLKNVKSKIRLDECVTQSKKVKKMRSSVDTQFNYYKENARSLKNQMKEIKNSRKKSKSDDNFAYRIVSSKLRSGNTKNSFTSQDITLVPEKLVYNKESACAPLDHNSETSETCDELGILFSQHIKLQTLPCQRKYCLISRHLRQRTEHSIKKCQIRFNYHQIYPHDQRPACNSGNICADTYDELQLMRTSPSERNNVYRCMFKRRKQFLNQPCTLPTNQNFQPQSNLVKDMKLNEFKT